MTSRILEFNYDISCPFAYIASTRIDALAARSDTVVLYRPVLLGAIYRATAAPQGAGGSASDVFNPAKKAVTAQAMRRTLRRYRTAYNPPPQHPRKTVNALRLLYAVEGEERQVLTEKLFRAYWVEGRDVNDDEELLRIVGESGIASARTLSKASFVEARVKTGLERATTEAIERGAFGVPGFWIPEAIWEDVDGELRKGRFFWGQDRMHFVEAMLLAMEQGGAWTSVDSLMSLMPRCHPRSQMKGRVRLEFWYDLSSPWAFLGWTQLKRLKRTYGPSLEIVLKPFLLGILFREIGAPNLPGSAISPSKAMYSRQDHADWVNFWNAVNAQTGHPDKPIDFYWAETFPIRTPLLLRCALADPSTVPILYRACWEQNADVSRDSVLAEMLTRNGYDAPNLISKANTLSIKNELRQSTAEAIALGLCGAPSYRVLRQTASGDWEHAGGIIWGQDAIDVVEDLIVGWDDEHSEVLAEPRKDTCKLAPRL